MATNKKTAAKPTNGKKNIVSAKNAAPAKKAVVVNKKEPVKKVATKAPVKKNAPAKKAATPVKKAAPARKAAVAVKKVIHAKAAAKSTPAKKVVPAAKKAVKSIAPTHNQKTVNKKDIKPAPQAKKATPAKKIEVPKKAAPVKKAVAPVPAKKAAPAKPAPKATAAKPAAKATPVKPVVKETPAAPAKKAATPPPAPQPAPKPATPAKKGTVKKKTLTLSQIPVKAGAQPRPTPTPSVRSTEKKPTVIIAHRRMENKSKSKDETPVATSNYQQETYRSILDEPQQSQGPVYRYSDDDLNEFREIIASRLDAARKELNYLQGLITRKDEAGTEDTENRYMNMEDGSGAMEREQLAQLASRQIQFMGHLEKALVRIENKTYGICRVTGKLIDKARLRAVPHATLSIEAKNLMAPKG
jgi:RNA polymerase-binding transcription factor DksA